MNFDVEFKKQDCCFDMDFGVTQTADTGNFEDAYNNGYENGKTEGYIEGKEDGYNKGLIDGACDVDHDALYQQGFADGKAIGGTGKQQITGTFTLNANATTPTIEHNCGFIPTLFIVYPIDECPNELTTENQMILGCVVTNTDYFSNIPSITNTSNAILEVRTTGVSWNFSTTKDAILTNVTAILGYAVGSRLWKAGFQYGWIAFE